MNPDLRRAIFQGENANSASVVLLLCDDQIKVINSMSAAT
jgi:hypothetical protein